MKKIIVFILAVVIVFSCFSINAVDTNNPDNYPIPTRSIKYQTPRCQGNDVKWVQAVFYQLGYDIAVDGSFGPASTGIVKDFQKKHGLSVDGSVGPATRSVMIECWNTKKLESPSVGSYIKLGTFEQDNNYFNGKEAIEWKVLTVDKENQRALIISKYTLVGREFNSSYSNTTWNKCSLRTWLNDTFYNAAFSTNEKEKILITKTSTEKNPQYSTEQGSNVSDRLFVLSINEVQKYFANNSERICAVTNLAGSATWTSEESGKPYYSWWMRNLGMNSSYAAYIDGNGTIQYGGRSVLKVAGVRPAMWIKVKVNNSNQNQVTDKYNPDNWKTPTSSARKGTQGNDAYWVQAILYQLGFTITVDGDFGNKTAETVKSFQSKYGLSADGSVGPATRSKMIEAWNAKKNGTILPTPKPTAAPTAAPTPGNEKYNPDNWKVPTNSVRVGSKGNDAYWVQAVLYQLGFDIAVDGSFGKGTANTVKQFQEKSDLTADGSVGPATRGILEDAWKGKKAFNNLNSGYKEVIRKFRDGLSGSWIESYYGYLDYFLWSTKDVNKDGIEELVIVLDKLDANPPYFTVECYSRNGNKAVHLYSCAWKEWIWFDTGGYFHTQSVYREAYRLEGTKLNLVFSLWYGDYDWDRSWMNEEASNLCSRLGIPETEMSFTYYRYYQG